MMNATHRVTFELSTDRSKKDLIKQLKVQLHDPLIFGGFNVIHEELDTLKVEVIER